jgi:tRNA-dihydrouridine synthase
LSYVKFTDKVSDMQSFWNSLPKPFMALAPMADVTDPAYRRLIAQTGRPDITWTEFISADGLFHTREKKGMKDEENPLVRDLLYGEGERPILAQFFTSNPDTMEYAARFALEHGFDGIDINMGCPDKSIEKQGAGAAHIKNPEQAKEVIRAAVRGATAPDGRRIPVSVKTRIGYNKVEYQEWLPHLLETEISALTVHLRTRKEMSLVPAHYELASDIVTLCRKENPQVLLLANGDLQSVAEAKTKALEHGFDGMMLGRAIFGNPWLFSNNSGFTKPRITAGMKLEALLTLARYFDELRPRKHYAILKKHFKAFVGGWDGAAELRGQLMNTNALPELEDVARSSGLL